MVSRSKLPKHLKHEAQAKCESSSIIIAAEKAGESLWAAHLNESLLATGSISLDDGLMYSSS